MTRPQAKANHEQRIVRTEQQTASDLGCARRSSSELNEAMNGGNRRKRLNICMLLPIHDDGAGIRVCPQTGIASYLTNLGHRVSWVIWSVNKQEVESSHLDGIEVHSTREIHYLPSSVLPGRILNKIPNTIGRIRHVLRVFREGKYSLVFVRSDVFDGLVAAYIRRRYKAPFVLELSSPLEQPWESHKIERNRPNALYYLTAKLVEFTGKRLLHEADLILPTSKWFKAHLAEQGIPETKMMSYPNGVDTQAFRDNDGTAVRQKYNLDDAKVVVYIGTLGKTRRLTTLIQAFAAVARKTEHVKLLIVGEGSDDQDLKRLAEGLGIADGVVFTGQVPQAEVPSFIAASDIGVSPVPPLSFYKLSSPIKMFEYMAMAKPVVANEEIPEHKEVLEQSGGGILVPFTPEGFAGAVMKLLDDPARAAKMGMNGREWVLNNRTYEILARRVEEAYYRLLEMKR